MTALDRGSAAAIPGAVDLNLFGGKVRLLGFGKHYPNPNGVLEKQDWSLRGFNDPRKSPPRTHSIMRYLPKIARDFDLGKMLYAASPRLFNAQVCTEADTMKKRIMVTSDDYHDTVWLLRGKDADGMILGSGHTYVVSPAGCPVLVLWDEARSRLGVAHAGMRSLINEPPGGEPDGRPYDSVVDNLLHHMGCLGDREATKRLQAVIDFPIPAKDFTYPFDHPKYGEKNQARSILIATKWGVDCTPGLEDPKLARRGMIDLDMLIRAQLCLRGVPPGNILTLPLPHGWYTTRESKEDELKRNLVLVQHL